MRAARLPYRSGIQKTQQLQFRGYQHTVSSSEGQIWDEWNISGRAYPYLRPIREREEFEYPCDNALFSHDALGWVKGTQIWYDNHLVGYVQNSPKQVAVMGDRIVIFPDKVVLNAKYKRLGVYETLKELKASVTDPKEFDAYGVGYAVPYELYAWNGSEWVSYGPELKSLESRALLPKVTFKNGTYKGVEAKANTMEATINVENLGFKPGDAVEIKGCTKHKENNKIAIIREIEGYQLRFYENAFVLDGEDGLTAYTEPGNITIARTVPDMDVICAVDNRLFGAKDDTLYASKLGDPENFNVFDGLTTDSWFQETGTAGAFTGCIPYLGYPIFFKEGHIFKIYGKNAENFEPSKSATMGVKAGAWRSLAVAGEVLYYLSDNGLVAYTGGIPESVAAPFGEVKYTDAVAGSDGRRLYLSMKRLDGKRELFCLDSESGLLHKEDNLAVAGFCRFGGVLYAMQEAGNAVVINADSGPCPDSMVEFGDFMEGTMDRKGVSRLQMRVVLDAGAKMDIFIQYDSSGEWRTVKTMTATRKQSFSFPVKLRRCDHYRIKLQAEGYWELHAMAKEFYVGSGVH